jgi:hypothetical protein
MMDEGEVTMTMNANSSLNTYGQLPESLACAEQVDGLYREVNAAAIRWWDASGGVVGDITVEPFNTDGSYRVCVVYWGFKVYFPDLAAADSWIERMEAARNPEGAQ